MEQHDLLIEIFTEELPPKRLQALEYAFLNSIRKQLVDAELAFAHAQSFATPRRLAVLVHQLAEQQPTQKIEYRGPSVTVAYNTEKHLTPAGLGFLKKCNITAEQLSTIQTDKGECLYFTGEKPGLSVDALIPDIVKNALKELPIPKAMRWADHDFSFIRPVHSVILLYGERIIPAEFFGLQTHRRTYGHRQLSHGPIEIGFPENYATELEEQGCVIVDSEERKAIILEQINLTLQALSEAISRGHLKIAVTERQEYESLLDEITALVEWPRVLLCRFDESFLTAPKEALMASMQGHQKCFAIADQNDQLLPYFITVCNLSSQDETAVIRGNERVMRARLSDAKFFYETDLKTPLESYTSRLANTIYQEKLGTLADKVIRIKKLSSSLIIACVPRDRTSCAGGSLPSMVRTSLGNASDDELAGSSPLVIATARAAELCKLDLFSHMVGEFPELQGIMGKYYALHEGESSEIATAIEEHYWPRFAEDKIPTAPVSIALALADRLDTIMGFFSVGLIPTGDKDPFGLKRAALGALKIIIENKLAINLGEFLKTENLIDFFKERFKTIILEKGISIDVFRAITNIFNNNCFTITALDYMKKLQEIKYEPEVKQIYQVYKRIDSVLRKSNKSTTAFFNINLTENAVETKLYEEFKRAKKTIQYYLSTTDEYTPPSERYPILVLNLLKLTPTIDELFEKVMIQTENMERRNNRLYLLEQLQTLFLKVADFSELQLPMY